MDDRNGAPARVLHIFGRMERGGAEMRLIELLGRFAPGEFRVDVCALSGLPGSLDPEVYARGGEVVPLRLGWSFPLRFIRLLRRGRYRVVHSHVLYASGPILALAKLAGIPVRVAHFHGTRDGRQSTWWRRCARAAMRGLIDRSATDIIACGAGSMEAIWGSDWQANPRCRVVYDALDPERFDARVDRAGLRAALGVPAAAPLFLHVGNQTPAKNHVRLLQIFAAIRELAPASWLVLAGARTNDPDGLVMRAIDRLGLGDRVIALGMRDDVPALLQTADALLLPSLWEGLPGVVLEACVAGVPVLATDLPGVREIATRLELVRSLPLSASDAEWARAALALPAQAAPLHLRDRARDAFQRSVFHVDRCVQSHRELYRGRREPLTC